jgi:simple sugar transport system ATP-binding protein
MDSPSDSVLLEMRGISKRFPGVQALDAVDFTLRRGEVHALMGENGAGKSTLIKVLTGVHPLDAGGILLEGQAVRPASPMQAEAMGISTVYQEVNLIPHLSVAENICLGRQPTSLGTIRWGAMARRAEAAMARLGLAIDVRRQVSGYSIAIQQMVSIARALDISARVLILDEPTSSLDENEVEQLFGLLRRLRGQGIGIIFITHFLDQVYRVSDQITVLRNGGLVGQYQADQLPRIELIARMIGKDPAEIAPEAAAAGTAETQIPEETPFVALDGLGRRGAVSSVSMDLRRGQVVGLAGLLGSGRTETARLLFGIDRPDSGSIRVDGQGVTIQPPRWHLSLIQAFRFIGYFLARRLMGYGPRRAIRLGFAFIPEDRRAAGIIPNLSVRENIMLALQASRGAWRRLTGRKQAELVEKFITALDIRTPGAEQLVANLSGGNQQKVLVARWLATEPRLLILDEPTRGIDVGAKAEIEKLIARLRRAGMAILFISSELDEVVRTSQRVVVLRDRTQVAQLAGGLITEQAIMHAIASGGAAHD